MKRGPEVAQVPLFGAAPAAASGPPLCKYEGCGKALHRGGKDGMHSACAAKAARAADPSVEVYKRLAAHWSAEFQRVRGEPPIWSGKDRGALKKAAEKLVPEVGEARVLKMITLALERDTSISFMVNEPNAFVGERPRFNRNAPRQVLQGRAPPRPQEPRHAPPPLPDDSDDPWNLSGDDHATARR